MTYKGVVIPGPDIDRLIRGMSQREYGDLRTQVSQLQDKLASSEAKRKKLIYMLERETGERRRLKEKYEQRGQTIHDLIQVIVKYRREIKELGE